MVKFDKFQSSLVKLSGSSSVDALIREIVSYIKDSIKNISIVLKNTMLILNLGIVVKIKRMYRSVGEKICKKYSI